MAGSNEVPRQMERLWCEKGPNVGNRGSFWVRDALSMPIILLESKYSYSGAHEILEEYWAKIGGKPEPGETKAAKKRGRQSTGSQKATPDTTGSKRPRTSKPGRKSNGAMQQDVDNGNLIGFTEVGEDNWKPPAAKPGSWDPLVQSIDTVVRESSDGELWAYLIWNEKNDKGRFYRSKAVLPTIYKACPQRVSSMIFLFRDIITQLILCCRCYTSMRSILSSHPVPRMKLKRRPHSNQRKSSQLHLVLAHYSKNQKKVNSIL